MKTGKTINELARELNWQIINMPKDLWARVNTEVV